MVRTAVLLKSENGQYQVLNISGAPGSALPGTAYRLQSVPVTTEITYLKKKKQKT